MPHRSRFDAVEGIGFGGVFLRMAGCIFMWVVFGVAVVQSGAQPLLRTQRIALEAGYNLISIQVGVGVGYPIDEFKTAIQSQGEIIGVWGFEPWAEPWEGGDLRQHPGVVPDVQRVFPGRGYLIQLSEPGTLVLNGPLWDGPVTLWGGWNLIGFPGLATDKPYVYELPSVFKSSLVDVAQIQSIESGVTPKVVRFDRTSSPPVSDLTSIQPGQAYWVFTMAPVTLAPEPVVGVAENQADNMGGNTSNFLSTAVNLTPTGEASGIQDIQLSGTIWFDRDTNQRTLVIRNAGSGLINWVIEEQVDWLEVQSTFGTLSSMPTTIELTVNRQGLSGGTHPGSMTLHAGSLEQRVDLSLEVAAGNDTEIATTDPVGYTTMKLKGNSLNFVGLNMVRPVVHQGWLRVNGSDRSIVSLYAHETDLESQLDLEHSQFDQQPHFLEIRSDSYLGWHSDIIATDGDEDTVQLVDSLPGDIDGSVRYVIRRHWTVGLVFGAENEAGLKAGTPFDADLVLLWDPTANDHQGGYRQLFYSNNPVFGMGWREVNETGDRSNEIIHFTEGFLIERRGEANTTIRLAGDVKPSPTRVLVRSGLNYMSNLDPIGITTLKGSGFVPGLTQGTPFNGDLILIPVVSGSDVSYDQYFYSNSPVFGGDGWRKINGSGDQGDTVLPVGGSYLIERRGSEVPITLQHNFE